MNSEHYDVVPNNICARVIVHDVIRTEQEHYAKVYEYYDSFLQFFKVI